jgi:hypothetical protein
VAQSKVCFLFIAQQHQVLHAISLAAELSRSSRHEIHVAAATGRHLDYIRAAMRRLGAGRVRYHRLWPEEVLPLGRRSIPPKAVALGLNLPLLSQFDAIVTPERSSLMLKWMGLRDQIFIHTDHGAGDRAVGYEARIAQFDLVLLAGEKQKRRMAQEGLLHDGGYAVVGYPKFDAVDALAAAQPPPSLFADPGRPTVLYNPHFHRELSSWRRFGMDVLKQFAGSTDYNLIFAPHVRLFDGARAQAREAVMRFGDHANIHVDLGGERAWDMTYTRMADLYLGDVSSQVYEFLRQPKPCLFLNATGVDWRGDENYAHWSFGPVLDGAEGLIAELDTARASHSRFAPAQRAAFADTFSLAGPASKRAAAAVSDYLQARTARPQVEDLPARPAAA